MSKKQKPRSSSDVSIPPSMFGNLLALVRKWEEQVKQGDPHDDFCIAQNRCAIELHRVLRGEKNNE